MPEFDTSRCSIFPKTQFSMLVPDVEKHMKQFPGMTVMSSKCNSVSDWWSDTGSFVNNGDNVS